MSGTGFGDSTGARGARAKAVAVLRTRSTATAVALVPAAVAVVLLAGGVTGRLSGAGWDTARGIAAACAVVVLLAAASVAATISRAAPALTPTVDLSVRAAPDLHRLVEDLAVRLDVPAPSGVALTPDCDSWLEDRSHPAHRISGARGRRGRAIEAPVLVIGSPFLWWMRVAELRAVLAPVVAGAGLAADPDIAAARRFVRGLDAAVADAAHPPRSVRLPLTVLAGRIARLLLRTCRTDAAEMERWVAAAASERAQGVDYGLRIVAQEQVGLAYAGWDRLLTRVALPAWRMGRWPSQLDAGVVSALTELSRRDRLADGFTSRLNERPACDLLEEPGTVDEAVSLLAARLFHGGPAAPGRHWAPVEWDRYPAEVVDHKWRTEAARIHRVLDELGVPAASGPGGPTLARVMEHLSRQPAGEASDGLAAALTARMARDETAAADRAAPAEPGGDLPAPVDGPPAPAAREGADEMLAALWGGDLVPPPLPLQPPRAGRDLLADHVVAMVCCTAIDAAGAAPGLDWLDGPTLLVDGERRSDLLAPVLSLVEEGDAKPLRVWLGSLGVRPESPVRLV
ncbi:hypothetical protein [Streptomyces genisteinicus]|uniref:Uncharacterized protein n=1 Tax=Streptomyces genisteinicus TaxID=2768068 RepID=A0A7H0HU71_9ACTN|nr:hypothetical protein [Streptomyces genisteinicus]QNP64087.1 hypothetical protein IAG43_14985 [Streptomyces genisteinicus]